MNFYVYEGDFTFIGILNKDILLKQDLTAEQCQNLTLGELCKNNTAQEAVINWSEEDNLIALVNEAFQNYLLEEVVVIETLSHHLLGIINRTDFYNEMLTIAPESDEEMLCYRQVSHYYKFYPGPLNQYALNINSQHGEDGILREVFNRIGTTSKYAVEFGGWDGIYLSNIRNLIVERGFGGLFIEGEADRAENLKNNYKEYPNVQCEQAFVGFQGENKLDNILLRNNAPSQIDLLSIDIDGYDYHVWDALENYRPRVVIIEYNPSVPNDIMLVNPHKDNIFIGSSAAALVELGRKKEYSLIAVTQTNLLFVVNEEYEKLEIWDNSLDTLRSGDKLSDGKFFQTYDGRIVFTGFNSYIWSGKPFGSGENQYIFTNI